MLRLWRETMAQLNYEQTTDSHLAKKYNDIVYDCMMRANVTSYSQESEPHFTNLMPYAAAVHILYKNTFMLFYSIKMGPKGEKVNLANVLYNKIKYIKSAMRWMKRHNKQVTPDFFEEVEEQCHIVHMLIHDGLQSLNMLVRMGHSEPRGEKSVKYWEDKAAFKKGGLKQEKIPAKKQVGLFLK